MDSQGWAPEGCELFLVVTEEVGADVVGCQGRCFARALRTLVCYYAGAHGRKKDLLWRFDPGALSDTG